MASTVRGKRIGENTYIHVEALPQLEHPELKRARRAQTLAGVEAGAHFNLVRMHADGTNIALLSYPRFFEEPFPSLQESWLVDLDSGSVSYRTYADSLNPPILHRKELLLPGDDPRREPFAELTAAADFIIDDEDMGEVAQWIVANTPFDRLNFYGKELPVHVSYGPDHSRLVVRMIAGKSGRLVPRVMAPDDLRGL